MPVSLAQAALEVLRDRRKAESLVTSPRLLWKAPLVDDGADAWAHTGTVSSGAKPKPGEALVFTIEKRPGTKNPFAMGVTLGRVETNDVRVSDGSISRFHAYFQRDERSGLWFVTDAESRNGTFVRGRRLTPNLRQKLGDDVALRFGHAELRFFTPPAFIRFVEQG